MTAVVDAAQTMQVWTLVLGQTALIASGRPVRPSQTARSTSPTPRALSAFTTLSQNLAPSVVTIHIPRTSLRPTAVGLEGGGTGSDENRYALRQGGITSLVGIDGGVYLPRGQSLAGTPIDVRMHVNAVVHDLWHIEREGTLAELLKRGGFSAEATQRLQPLLHEDQFGFSDPVRGHFCPFGRLLGNW